MRNRIQDLRDHLFATIEGLLDEDKPLDIDRARAVAGVAQAVINSAKVECDYLRVTGSARGTGFIPDATEDNRPKLVKGK